jgi:hypothetical protein
MMWTQRSLPLLWYFHLTESLPGNKLLVLSHLPHKLWRHHWPQPCSMTWYSEFCSFVSSIFSYLQRLSCLIIFTCYTECLLEEWLFTKSHSHVAKKFLSFLIPMKFPSIIYFLIKNFFLFVIWYSFKMS